MKKIENAKNTTPSTSEREIYETVYDAPTEVVNEEIIDDEDQEPPVLDREEPVIQEGSPSKIDENVVMIDAADFAEAGLDEESTSLTPEQIAILMEVHEKRNRERMAAQNEERAIVASNSQNYISAEAEVIPQSGSVTIVINDDGLKLTNASNQSFFFTGDQLKEMNVDINNLTDENLNYIYQACKDVQSSSNQETAEDAEKVATVYEEEVTIPSNTVLKPNSELLRLVDQSVEIRRPNGDIDPVTIRYVKHGGALKVQFEDGHFEWINEDQIVLTRSSNDHDRYHNDVSARVVHPSASINALKRAATAVARRETKRINLEPNFCCPICENKVYQKEPAYIVIRIPACDSCTKEKIIVLDDERDNEVI